MTERVTVLGTATVPIDSVRPHPANPRRGDMGRIERSLRDHGQYAPLIVHESTGHILAGNHRWRAAKDKLGWTHVNVQFIGCTDIKALEILAMDNRSSDDGTYNDEELLALLEQINTQGQLAAAGYDVDELDDLLARLEEDAPVFEPEPDQPKAPARSVILTYPEEEYDQVVLGLQHMCARYEVGSFSAAVAAMIPELED